jgi:K+-transporting ATPase A subunit
MAAKTITPQKFCQDCNQRHNCQQIYQQLGKAQGPSLVSRVVVAFLLPLMVFIAALVVFEEILAKAINAKELQTTLCFLLALSVTLVCAAITKAINTQLDKNK